MKQRPIALDLLESKINPLIQNHPSKILLIVLHGSDIFKPHSSAIMQAVSNLWMEECDWLMLRDPGVREIFGIAVDPLTENIFYIIPEAGYSLESVLNTSQDIVDIGDGVDRTKQEVADLVEEKVKSTLERLLECGRAYGPLKEENIFLQQGQVVLENRLILKQSWGSANKHSGEEHQQNLKALQCIMESVMKLRPTEIK